MPRNGTRPATAAAVNYGRRSYGVPAAAALSTCSAMSECLIRLVIFGLVFLSSFFW